MRAARWLAVGLCAMGTAGAGAQEYRIGEPTEVVPRPVYLTEPVEGRVEVTNLPPEQPVRITGSDLTEPIEVRGAVSLESEGPLQVEVVNPLEIPETLRIQAPVRVDDEQPVRVWVENPPPAAHGPESPSAQEYAGYVFGGKFSGKQTALRRVFTPPPGAVFELTDLVLNTRPEAILWVRVMSRPSSVVGTVTRDEEGPEEIPLLALDPRSGPTVSPSTPVPLRGSFVVEVEAPATEDGAPFQVLVSGTVRPLPIQPTATE